MGNAEFLQMIQTGRDRDAVLRVRRAGFGEPQELAPVLFCDAARLADRHVADVGLVDDRIDVLSGKRTLVGSPALDRSVQLREVHDHAAAAVHAGALRVRIDDFIGALLVRDGVGVILAVEVFRNRVTEHALLALRHFIRSGGLLLRLVIAGVIEIQYQFRAGRRPDLERRRRRLFFVVERHAEVVAVIRIFLIEFFGIEIIRHHQFHAVDPGRIETVRDRHDVGNVHVVRKEQVRPLHGRVVFVHRERIVFLPVPGHRKARAVRPEIVRKRLEVHADRPGIAEHRITHDGFAGIVRGIEDRRFGRTDVDVLKAARSLGKHVDETVAVGVLRPVVRPDDEAEFVGILAGGNDLETQIRVNAEIIVSRERVGVSVPAVRRIPGPDVPGFVAGAVIGGIVVSPVMEPDRLRLFRRHRRIIGVVLRILRHDVPGRGQCDRHVVGTFVLSRLGRRRGRFGRFRRLRFRRVRRFRLLTAGHEQNREKKRRNQCNDLLHTIISFCIMARGQNPPRSKNPSFRMSPFMSALCFKTFGSHFDVSFTSYPFSKTATKKPEIPVVSTSSTPSRIS